MPKTSRVSIFIIFFVPYLKTYNQMDFCYNFDLTLQK